jgi:hypothetical protein
VKKVLLLILLSLIVQIPLYADKKIAKIKIEVNFDRYYVLYSGAGLKVIFLDNKKAIIMDKEENGKMGAYEIQGPKIKITTKDKVYTAILLTDNIMEFDGQQLKLEK